MNLLTLSDGDGTVIIIPIEDFAGLVFEPGIITIYRKSGDPIEAKWSSKPTRDDIILITNAINPPEPPKPQPTPPPEEDKPPAAKIGNGKTTPSHVELKPVAPFGTVTQGSGAFPEFIPATTAEIDAALAAISDYDDGGETDKIEPVKAEEPGA